MLLALGFLLVLLFGYFITLSISTGISRGEKISLSFGLGLGFLSLLMFYMSRLNIVLTPLNLISSLILLIVFVYLLFLKGKNAFSGYKVNFKKIITIFVVFIFTFIILYLFNWGRINISPKIMLFPAVFYALAIIVSIIVRKKQLTVCFVLSLLVFSFLSIVIMGIYWPIHEWDSLALYDFRGKLFFWQEAISFPKDLPDLNYYAGYPFLTSTVHAFVYLLGSVSPKFIYPLYYGAILLFFNSFLRKETNSITASFFTLLLGTSYVLLEQGAGSYANLPFAFYQTAGALFLYRFMRTKRVEYLLYSGLNLGLSAWTKPGADVFFLACFLVLLTVSLSRRGWLNLFIFLGIYVFIGHPWEIYVKYALGKNLVADQGLILNNVVVGFHGLQSMLNLSGFVAILKTLFSMLTDFKLYGAGGILFFLVSILDIKISKREKELFFLIIFNFLFWIISIYIYGLTRSFNLHWFGVLNDSMVRIFLGTYPLLFFYAAKSEVVRKIFAAEKK